MEKLTATNNFCFLCQEKITSLNIKTETQNYNVDTESNPFSNLNSREKISTQFCKLVSRFINLDIVNQDRDVLDPNNLVENNEDKTESEEFQMCCCCDNCFISVQTFCEVYEAYQCLRIELLRILDSISNIVITKSKNTKSDKPSDSSPTETIFRKQFISKVEQKLKWSFPRINLKRLPVDNENIIINNLSKKPKPEDFALAPVSLDKFDDDHINDDFDYQDDPYFDINDDDVGDTEVDIVEGKFQPVAEINTKVDVEEDHHHHEKKHTKKNEKPKLETEESQTKLTKGYNFGPLFPAGQNRILHYYCLICPKKYRFRNRFLDHLRHHLRERIYFCCVCRKEFPTKAVLKIHQRKIHRVTTNEDIFKQTQAKKRGIRTRVFKPATCDLCQETFDNRRCLNLHLTDVHKQEKKFECEVCGEKYFEERYLTRHRQIHQNKTERPFQCDLCPKKFTLPDNLSRHKRQMHLADGEVIHRKIKKHFCDTCGKGFVFPSFLMQHKADAHGDESPNVKLLRRFKCPHENCTREFFNKSSLGKHVVIHTGDKCHQCDHCGKSFAFINNFRSHIRRYHPEVDLFKCPECDEGFQMNELLKEHMKNCKPELINDHVCDHCGKHFDKLMFLNRHLVMYHDAVIENVSKDFKCSWEGCDWSFFTKQNLDNHEKTHTRVKSCICQHCGESYIHERSLWRHVKFNHSGNARKFLCRHCGKGFKIKRLLVYHETHVHKDETAANEEGGGGSEKVGKIDLDTLLDTK